MRIAPRVGSSACSLTKPRRDAVADERDVERAAHDAQQQQQAERDAAYAPSLRPASRRQIQPLMKPPQKAVIVKIGL